MASIVPLLPRITNPGLFGGGGGIGPKKDKKGVIGWLIRAEDAVMDWCMEEVPTFIGFPIFMTLVLFIIAIFCGIVAGIVLIVHAIFFGGWTWGTPDNNCIQQNLEDYVYYIKGVAYNGTEWVCTAWRK